MRICTQERIRAQQDPDEVKNRQIAGIFSDIADLLEIKSDNPFRIRAYRRAAQEIEGLADDILAMSEEMLPGLPGIGKDLAGKIREFLITGKDSLWPQCSL